MTGGGGFGFPFYFRRERTVKDMRRKRTTIWAYLDGERLVDVVQAALDNDMMVDDMKALLVAENPGHEVTFRVE